MKNRFFNKLTISLFATLALFLVTSCSESKTPSALDGMLIINEDAWHFFDTRTPEQMTLDGLNAFIDQYAGTKITHLFLNPNSQAARFQSQTRSTVWDTESKEIWPQNAKLLHERGLDPYKIWIDRCREKKISPWISMRMNDAHHMHEINHFHHTSFWRNNPSFWRVPNEKNGHWSSRALNYVHPEVQEHQMSFVRELFERYDFDGLELDWMRAGKHSTPGKEKEESIILNKFMQDVRKIAREWEKKRGHTIYLAVRTHYDPDVAAARGMDVLQWAREGSVDLVIPTPYWETNFDIPVERWRERLDSDVSGHSVNVAIAPGMEMHAQAWPDGKEVRNDLATLYGFVASARFRGARNIYLYNWMDPSPGHTAPSFGPVDEKDYRTLLEKGIGDDVLLQSVRRFPVGYDEVGYREIVPGVNSHVQLPQTLNSEAKFTIPIGQKPVSGKLRLIVGLAANESVKEAVLSATLNGKNTQPVADAELEGFSRNEVRALQFDCPLDTAKDGTNNIVVSQSSGTPQKIVWIELCVEPDRK
jgi:hypothetical protein